MTTEAPASGPPLARQRQQFIVDAVARHGGIRVAEVVEALGVSEMTVRRDINELVGQGLVERVHGGAVAPSTAAAEPLFTTKAGQHEAAKAAIGRRAAARVRPGDALLLTAGSTTLAVARALVDLEHLGTLTVLTNSLPAAQVLHEAAERAHDEGRPAATVVLTGGERTRSDALVGPVAVDALRSLRVEWAFLGAHGADAERGLMSPNLAEAQTNAAMVAAARVAVAVVDATKWGVPGLRTFCSLDDLAVLVTDAPPPPTAAAALESHDVVLDLAQE